MVRTGVVESRRFQPLRALQAFSARSLGSLSTATTTSSYRQCVHLASMPPRLVFMRENLVAKTPLHACLSEPCFDRAPQVVDDSSALDTGRRNRSPIGAVEASVAGVRRRSRIARRRGRAKRFAPLTCSPIQRGTGSHAYTEFWARVLLDERFVVTTVLLGRKPRWVMDSIRDATARLGSCYAPDGRFALSIARLRELLERLPVPEPPTGFYGRLLALWNSHPRMARDGEPSFEAPGENPLPQAEPRPPAGHGPATARGGEGRGRLRRWV
jgi:hypothetical protein